MKKLCLFLFIFIFFKGISFAQTDSVRNQPAKKFAILLAFDSRNTFLELNKNQDNAVNLYGVQMGARYKRWKYWIGYANITASSKAPQRLRSQPAPNPNNPDATFAINRELSLYFFTLTPEYIFFYRPYLELSVPLEFGIGSSDYKQINEKGNVVKNQQGLFVPIESGLNILIKPTRWVGIIARGGYRKTINVSGFNADYDGWYYNYGVAIFLGNIYRDLKKKK